MLLAELIRRKRDGKTLSSEEVSYLAKGIADGSASDAQVAAFAMAVFFQGMVQDEAAGFTAALRDTGTVLDWSDLPGPVTDKHSTGGVGDNVSLMLAPIVAACGAFVPMISGRGLGHTGGTLDKMAAIPGYTVLPDTDRFRRTVRETGCAIIGQTGDLAPADGRLYGIRDVTATVESIPLITASILSKKLAAGLQSLVLDVKTGNGAFMADPDDARALAESLTRVSQAAGLPCHALLTDMSEPLASAAGNAVEVRNAVEYLRCGATDERLHSVVMALAAEMLVLAGLAASRDGGMEKAEQARASGRAAEVFDHMVAGLGGPVGFIDAAGVHLPEAPVIRPVPAPTNGVITAYDTRRVGLAVVELGGGRRRASDSIDPRVGFTHLNRVGTFFATGEAVAMVHAADDASADRASRDLLNAITFGEVAPDTRPVVSDRVT